MILSADSRPHFVAASDPDGPCTLAAVGTSAVDRNHPFAADIHLLARNLPVVDSILAGVHTLPFVEGAGAAAAAAHSPETWELDFAAAVGLAAYRSLLGTVAPGSLVEMPVTALLQSGAAREPSHKS